MTYDMPTFAQQAIEPIDVLLADTAIRIQLSRTDYGKAEARYRTISEWLDRPTSPLKDRVNLVYAQGSMAIGATIASRLRTDEYDIDILAELDFPLTVAADEALDALYWSIKGEPGSRYYTMTRRQTRCVTIDYEDNMHLDVTPAVRRVWMPEKESLIFHHRPETPHIAGMSIIANPFGFAEWFKANTPCDQDFRKFFEDRASLYENQQIELAKALETMPVQPQQPAHEKSKAVIVLQLMKRWRNVRYDRREVRRPPGILMAKMIATNANNTATLSEELLHQAQCMLRRFEAFHSMGMLIVEQNPVCAEDVLTDRWPGTLVNQEVFIRDLRDLVRKVERLRGDCDLEEMREIMADLFGESPTGAVFKSFNEASGLSIRSGQSAHRPSGGRFDLAGAGVVAAPAVQAQSRSQSTSSHSFYGGNGHE